MSTLNVLLTGAAGNIGQGLLGPFQENYQLRTCDQRPVPGDPDAIVADLQDLEAMRRACAGIDVVVHLAANPSTKATIEQLVPPNIFGLCNLYRAAQEAGVRRVVFASTCNVDTAYPRDCTVRVADPYRPGNIYGASKVFGEAVGRYYHDRHGLEVVNIRLGGYQPYENARSEAVRRDPNHWVRYLWLSPRDAVGIFRAAIERQNIGYATVFATSHVEREHLSLQEARELLDWEPEDRFEA